MTPIKERCVLILVLMEDALREVKISEVVGSEGGLNPCSNGRCSARTTMQVVAEENTIVLILVLMEDALRENLETNGSVFQRMS